MAKGKKNTDSEIDSDRGEGQEERIDKKQRAREKAQGPKHGTRKEREPAGDNPREQKHRDEKLTEEQRENRAKIRPDKK